MAKKASKKAGSAAAKGKPAETGRSRATVKSSSKKSAKPAGSAARKKPALTTRRPTPTGTGPVVRNTGRSKNAKAARSSASAAAAMALARAGNAVAIEPEAVDEPVDPGLTKEDIELFRRMLLEKRAEIMGDVATLHTEALAKDRHEASGDLSSMPIHMADLGTDNYELEFTLGLIEGERVILREIDEALERIKNKTYGVCQATGKAIGKARLRAKPWAKYCYEYTLAQEQGRGRRL